MFYRRRTSAFHVQWSSARQPRIERTNQELHVVAQGRRWRFASAAAPVIELLATGRPHSIADLSAQGLDPEQQFVSFFAN